MGVGGWERSLTVEPGGEPLWERCPPPLWCTDICSREKLPFPGRKKALCSSLCTSAGKHIVGGSTSSWANGGEENSPVL